MEYRLTTVDNPFDPFTQWDEWYAFDESQGYCTSGLVARLTRTSDELSIEDQQQAVSDAIDMILDLFPDGFYKKVSPEKK